MPTGDFSSAYDEHVWHVYGYFAYRLRSRADAEDLTQQTFERALRAWARYDPARASVATWLMAIAHNQLVDHLRSDPRAWQQPVDQFAEDTLEGAPDRHRIGIDPDLERALATLGDREREIVALRFGGVNTGVAVAATSSPPQAPSARAPADAHGPRGMSGSPAGCPYKTAAKARAGR